MKKINEIKHRQVSFCKSRKQPQAYDLSLEDALNQIKNDDYKEEILKLRDSLKQGKTSLATILKEKLPVFIFNASYTGRRIKENIKVYNNIIILDIDYLEVEELIAIKKSIEQDRYTLAVWISPRGKGLKVLIRTNNNIDNHKMAFSSLKNYYKDTLDVELDKSGSDVLRLCFVSHDKDLYINWEAEVFDSTVSEVKLTVEKKLIEDDKSTIEKSIRSLIKYLQDENKSITSTYDSWYKAAIAIQNVFPNAKGKKLFLEISRLDGNKHDEEKSIEKWNYCLKKENNGDSELTIRTLFFMAKNIGYNENNITTNYEVFWNITKKNIKKTIIEDVEIDTVNFMRFLQRNGFSRLKADGATTLVRIMNNVVKIINEVDVKDFVREFINNLPYKLSSQITRDHLLNKIINGAYVYFSKHRFDFFDKSKIEFQTDTKDEAYFYYKDCFVKVTTNGVEIFDYKKLTKHIWEKEIINRDFVKLNFDEYDKINDILNLIRNVCSEDENRICQMVSVIGYLLHRYKDPSFTKAAIFIDEEFGTKGANGGTGKSLLAGAIGKIRNQVMIDGKAFNPNKPFALQRIELDTNNIFIDDAKKDFPFDALYSQITNGITVERKNKDEILIDPDKSGKYVITSNYFISSPDGGNSDERRKIEVLFSNYYANTTPAIAFGHRLFRDWNTLQWNVFDNFMMFCTEAFISTGVFELANASLIDFKLYNEIKNNDFLKYVRLIPFNKEFEVVYLLSDFQKKFEGHDLVNQREFNYWLRRYVALNKIKTKAVAKGKSDPIEGKNSKQYIEFMD
jgi:hypothetical protein